MIGVPGTTGTPAASMAWRAEYLVAHGAHDVGLGPDPGQAALLHDLGEIGVLRQKPVAGMDGISPRHLGGA